MADMLIGADTNSEGIAYGITEVVSMGDLNQCVGAAHLDIPLVVKVNGTPVSAIGHTGLVLKEDGSQDHFEINVTTN